MTPRWPWGASLLAVSPRFPSPFAALKQYLPTGNPGGEGEEGSKGMGVERARTSAPRDGHVGNASRGAALI